MKKITLLVVSLLTTFFALGQETISFESAESYSLGDINTQNNWSVTGCGPGCFVANQDVSNEQSSDGSFSLKIDQDGAFSGQSNPVVGAFYTYAAEIPNASATFSADMFIDTFDSANTSDYIFGLVNTTEAVFRTYIRFTFEGNITVLVTEGDAVQLVDTMQDWTPLTWFNVRIEITNDAVEFFIDDVSIYSGTLATSGSIEQVQFAHDNFAGFAHIDNFRTNDEDLSVESFENNAFSYFYNKTTKSLELDASSPLQNVEIYNILGQKVISNTLNQTSESIDLQQLTNGVYLARIETENGSKSVKFLKQ
ncbi:T9SS type A sorting domain-containing protein [Winogradskyella sp. 3972H.M.0a.05]|uniref:T9SS type A sorting domain-containing protein n=1 Tax=Winogradskyella sp. 3972H.M.0a.05 TaxID=2950277 RepID=UPI00339B98CE